MAAPSERTVLITLRARVDRDLDQPPVITARRHLLRGAEVDEEKIVVSSAEAALGAARDWLSEFLASDD